MRKVTTRDVARRANVSQSTVSFVLSEKPGVSISEETREKVFAAAQELGYTPRRVAGRRHAGSDITIAIVAPTLSNLYYPFLLQNTQLYANEKGIKTILFNTLRDMDQEKQLLDAIPRALVDGILCLYTPKAQLPARLPTVIVSEKNPDAPYDTVGLNSYTAGHMMASHLASLGHRQIAYLSTPFGNITDSRRLRLEGLRAGFHEAGVDHPIHVIADTHEMERMDTAYEYNCGRALTEQLLREGHAMTAIVAVNDMLAAGCMAVLQEHGIRIPADIAVCGFDNLLIARMMQPQLTSIDQMAFHGSKTGLDILLEKIGKRKDDHELFIRVEYEPHLFVRGSTAGEAGNPA